MRIGFFTDGFLPQPNGVATSVFESAKELKRRGHEVFIIAPKYPGYRDAENVIRLTSVKIYKEPELRVALNLPDKNLRKILSMDFDVIHGHSGGPITFLGREIARVKKVPFVVTYHTLWSHYTHYFFKGKIVTPKLMERATKLFGNGCDYLIAPTERVEKELKTYGIKKPIAIIPSGIDTEKFLNAEPGALRKKTGIKEDPIILYVGRLGKEKSVDFLIKAFEYVYKNEQKAQFVMIGEGGEKSKLRSLAKSLGVDKNVHFLGNVKNEEMHLMYKDASVFVFSSTTETQGLVVPEALASGVPVVAIDDQAFESIEDSKNGFLVKNNKEEFALKVISILENKKLRETLSQNAKKYIEKLSIKTTTDNLEGLYYDLLDKQNKETTGKIMKQNRRQEQAFVIILSFWIAILFSRIAVFFSYSKFDPYPIFTFGESYFYHSSFGLVLVLLSLALILKKRSIGLVPLIFLGVGAGWVADEIWSMLFGATLIADYWNPYNLISILILGLLPLLFLRNNTRDKMEFYIGVKEQKHINPKNPKASVVVPAYNEGKFIDATLKSLLNQTFKEFELIVVDNNSTDDTGDVARKYGARVVVEKAPGVAHARQAGFFASSAPIIATTDADAVVPENWLETIVNAYDKDKNLVGYTGLSRLYSGPVSARAATSYLFYAFWLLDGFLSRGMNMLGSNMSVKRKAYLAIGGFRTNLPLGEDVDLAQRLKAQGKIVLNKDLLVFASGRRFKDGLLAGVMVYAPSWFARVVLRKDKFLNFPSVRTERGARSFLSYLPLGVAVVVLLGLFYLYNFPV